MRELLFLGIIGCILAAAVADAQPEGSVSVSVDAGATQISEVNNKQVLVAVVNAQEKDKIGRLLVQYTTSTQAVFVTTTTNALSTCFSATNTPACRRRRKKSDNINEILHTDINR